MMSMKYQTMLHGLTAVCLVAVLSIGQTAHGEGSISVGGVDQPGGTISGTVNFDGRQAKRKPIRMSSDATCAKSHAGSPPKNERFVFGDNGTLQNVFVWVSGGLEGKSHPAPQSPAVIDQIGCMYVPHVSGVVAGQALKIINSDTTLHNVKCQPKNNAPFNEGMPVKDMVLDKTFGKPEMGIPLKCDVHPWMTAYLHVMEHPFFAVTQADGTFEIKGLPAGEYELSVWHEFNKFTPDQETIKVTVEDGGTAEVTVTYSPKGKKK